MADNDWVTLPFDQAVLVNPPVRLERGAVYPFVDMQAVDPTSRSVGPSEERPFKGGGSRFVHGDTLMARITPCLENGKIARYTAPEGQGVGHGSTEFIVIRGRPNVTDNGFAFYLTKWDGVRQYCISQMTGSSGRQRVPTGALSHLEVTIPPLKEQEAIACILGALDDKIELNRTTNRTLEATARAIFQSWFVDFDPVKAKAAGRTPPGLSTALAALFPDSFEDSPLGPIPSGWRMGNVGELADFNAWTLGKRDPLDEIDYIEISEVMRGEVGDIKRYSRGTEPGRARRRLRHGDTAISTVRPDRGAYFLSINPPESFIASTGFAVLTAKQGCWAFVHVLTTRPEFGEELGRLADGGAYPAVRPEVIAARPAVVPASDVFEAFEKIAQPMFLRAERARQESRALGALRDTLLPKLISGELVVAEAERIAGRCV